MQRDAEIPQPRLPRRARLLSLFRRRDTWVLAALFIVASVAYCNVEDHFGKRGGVAELDGYYYYVYLRSLQMDGDIDLTNEYRLWGNPFAFGQTPTGKARNVFGIGPALAWSPFFLAANGIARVGRWAGIPLPEDGMSRFHQVVTLYGSVVFGWLAILFCYLSIKKLLGPSSALLSAIGAAMVGPLPYYCLTGAAYSHAAAAMASSLTVLIWATYRDNWTHRRWFAFGAAVGLALLCRPATAPMAILPLWEAIRGLRQGWTARKPAPASPGQTSLRQALRGPIWGLIGLVLLFSPQMIAWQILFGSPLVLPQGESFMWWSQSAWPATLFAPRNGLLPSAPLYAVALGCLLFAVRRPSSRPWAAILLLVFAAGAFVNGAAYDWWGWSFSARRFTYLLPVFALGLAYGLQSLSRHVAARPQRSAAIATTCIVLAFALFNVEWMAQFNGRNLRWHSVRTTRGLYLSVLNGMAERVYRNVGNPLSFPAAAAFALRHGEALERYDRVEGSYLLGEHNTDTLPFANPYQNANINMASARFRPHLDRSFGRASRDKGVSYVPLRRKHARLLLPINRPGPLRIWLRARAMAPGMTVSASYNGVAVGRQPLPDSRWATLFFEVPASRVRRGINRLDLIHHLPPPPRISRAIGTTGVTAPLDLAVASGGHSGGRFCELWAGSRRSICGRGVNIVTIAPGAKTPAPLRTFDADLEPGAFKRARAYLHTLKPGTIVMMGVRENVSRFFSQGGSQLLADFGAAKNLSLAHQSGYAAIGVLGSPPKTAIESIAKTGHARARVGMKPPPWRELARYSALRLR